MISATTPDAGAKHRHRVLLLDDDPDVIYALRMGLATRGFEIHAFTNPSKALAQFQPNYADFVVIDFKMPGMDGFEFYQEIRRLDPKVKIYFLSAYESYANKVKATLSSDPLVVFLRKPISYNVLAQQLT